MTQLLFSIIFKNFTLYQDHIPHTLHQGLKLVSFYEFQVMSEYYFPSLWN